MPPDENMPDFDSMSPEEIMAWMETLAKRQGADATEFTTEANVDIADVDPTSVQIDEPGYIPFHERDGKKKPAAASTPAQPPAQQAPPAQQQPPPAPPPPARQPSTPPPDRPARPAQPAQPTPPPPEPVSYTHL
ncbi:MAG: hypothetical protein GYB67_01430, partial [Chloroflexi bacterium]|nr:hypothetical protein [Chloroflexota bacterium]